MVPHRVVLQPEPEVALVLRISNEGRVIGHCSAFVVAEYQGHKALDLELIVPTHLGYKRQRSDASSCSRIVPTMLGASITENGRRLPLRGSVVHGMVHVLR
jgi:hypothetical protein